MTGCQARIPGVCEGMAQHRHHRQLRRFGDNSYVNLLEVCFACHHYIHHRVEWARTWGLLVPSWASPRDRHPYAEADPNERGPYMEPGIPSQADHDELDLREGQPSGEEQRQPGVEASLRPPSPGTEDSEVDPHPGHRVADAS